MIHVLTSPPQSNHSLALEEAGYTAQSAFMDLATPLEDAQDHVTAVQEVIDRVLAGVDTTVVSDNRAEGYIHVSMILVVLRNLP